MMAKRTFVTRISFLAATLLGMAACAMQPGEVNLIESFANQVAGVDGITDFARNGNELTFTGPDGQGGSASWRVQIESTNLVPRDEERVPIEGHIISSWYRDGELIEPIGTIYSLPQEFFNPGLAQDCYALWDTESNSWDW